MARTPACDIDGTTLDPAARPPNVQDVQLQTAVATYEVTICNGCLATRTIAELMDHATTHPGGTVDGAESLKYLIRRD